MTGINESLVEDAALAWLETLGYTVVHGPDIAIGMPNAERRDPNHPDVVLGRRLRDALLQLNPVCGELAICRTEPDHCQVLSPLR